MARRKPTLKAALAAYNWYNRRSGAETGGKHQADTAPGSLTSALETHFSWTGTVDLNGDVKASMDAIFDYNGMEYIQSNNTQSAASGYATFNFIEDHPTAPWMRVKTEFQSKLQPFTSVHIKWRYQFASGPPWYGTEAEHNKGRIQFEQRSGALSEFITGYSDVADQTSYEGHFSYQNLTILGQGRQRFYPLGDNLFTAANPAERIRVYHFEMEDKAIA